MWEATNAAAAEFQPKFDIKEFNISLSEFDDHDEKIQYACEYLDRYFKLVNDGCIIKVIEYEYGGRFIIGHREYNEKCAKARLCKTLIDGKNPYEFFKASDECVMYTSMVFDPTAGPMLDFPPEGPLNTFYGHRAEHVSRRLKANNSFSEHLWVIIDYIEDLCGGSGGTPHPNSVIEHRRRIAGDSPLSQQPAGEPGDPPAVLDPIARPPSNLI